MSTSITIDVTATTPDREEFRAVLQDPDDVFGPPLAEALGDTPDAALLALVNSITLDDLG